MWSGDNLWPRSLPFLRYPNIKEYMEEQINFAKTNYYVETVFGRRCNIKNINDKAKNIGR